MLKSVFIIAFMLGALTANSQGNMTIQQYIDTYKEIAISEMKRLGVPAAITLAQGILETESGNSELVKKSNNHFGIKCKSTWTGNSVTHDDDAKGECFRKYDNAEQSYKDHSDFLRQNGRYAFLFDIDPVDYKGWAYGLKKAGYATNPRYPQILIKNIEEYNLNQYTLEAIGLASPLSVNNAAVSVNNSTATASLEKRTFNELKAVYAPSGTSLLAIASMYNISLSKLLEFNDLDTDGLLEVDSWIYLEKKWKESTRESYTTQATENVYDIAQNFGVQLSYLLEYNGLGEDGEIGPNTRLWLKPGFLSQKQISEANLKFHVVQPKEGLYAISKKYNVSIDELKAWNSLRSDNLQVGQKLIISK